VAEYEIRWGTPEFEGESPDESIDLLASFGLSESDVDELQSSLQKEVRGAVHLRARVSSVGKGASGPGVALVLEVLGAVDGLATLWSTGRLLVKFITRVRGKFGHGPTIEDPDTLGAIAAVVVVGDEAPSPALLQDLRYVTTVPLTVGPRVGTDARDIWASVFALPDEIGGANVVFMSPTGLSLGSVRVPSEMFLRPSEGWETRSPRDIALWWGQDV
jgi:hypothetical protein